jgi:predicted nucleotidyltransferase component of viral defense system
MNGNKFDSQVSLLLRVLPLLDGYPQFALKGGTAINLFYRDMPRRSVDIDLVYLPLKDRDESLKEISDSLNQLSEEIMSAIPDSVTRPIKNTRVLKGKNLTIKLDVTADNATIRIEPNLVLRGTVYPTEQRPLCKRAEELFEMSTDVRCASFEDVFAGKICAALDRQHPRDLFDIHLLVENEGLSQNLISAFTIYLCGHNRPISEILNPNMNKDFQILYETEFEGMSIQPVHADKLVDSFQDFRGAILEALNPSHREFIIGFANGAPDWSLVPEIEHTKDFPSIKWKLINIEKMADPKKSAEVEAIRALF